MIQFHETRLTFPKRLKINGPMVIVQDSAMNGQPLWNAKKITGKFYRIIPSNWREIQFFQKLKKYQEVYAPAHGNGIIVKASIIDELIR